MFCSACGQKNTDDATFCTSCGKQITTSATAQPSSPSAAPVYVSSELKESGTVTAMSVVGFVFGLIGMMGSFIPCLGSLAFYIGIPAALISAIALGIAYSQDTKKTFAVVAVTISLIGVVISGWQYFSIISAGNKAKVEIDEWLKTGPIADNKVTNYLQSKASQPSNSKRSLKITAKTIPQHFESKIICGSRSGGFDVMFNGEKIVIGFTHGQVTVYINGAKVDAEDILYDSEKVEELKSLNNPIDLVGYWDSKNNDGRKVFEAEQIIISN